MKSRIVLLTLGFIGLLWILFISFDLLKIDAQPNFLSYFNESDQRVLVIHDWKEIDRNTDNLVLPPSNDAIINSLAMKLKDASFYVSTARPVIVIERNGNWNKMNVEELFKNGIYPFKTNGSHGFSFGKFSGQYAKNQLVLYACDVSQTNNLFQVDRKATYSIVSFLSNGTEICDVFKKMNSTYFYRKTKIGPNKFKKHDDKRLFASIIPDKFQAYSFFDKKYLASTDPGFKNSPFLKWINNGVIILRNDFQSLAIFDFKEGQNPIQNLNERLNKTELNEEFATYENIHFSTLINKDSLSELFIAESDGFCLVSHYKDYLDEVLTEIKMGHSLSQNEDKLASIYKDLPKKVTARIIDSAQTKAVTVIGQNSIEISFKKNDVPQVNETKKDREYFAMNPGEKVVDFAVFNDRGNLIALTETNKLVGYINGLRKWEKQMSGEVQLKPTLDRKYVCVFNKNESQLVDIYGKIHFRFASMKNCMPERFQNKSKEEFLVATAATNFAILNEQGATIKQFSCAGNIKEIAVQKTPNGRQMAMVLTNTMLYSIDLAKRKTVLKIGVDSLYHLGKDPSGIFAVSYQTGNLNILDLQGKKSTISIGNFTNDFEVISSTKGVKVALKTQQQVSVFNLLGKREWSKNLAINEITEISAIENTNGKLLFVILDGIENELYLLDQTGNNIDNSSKHGEQKSELSGFGARGFSITTYLGNYLIQYNK
jgi:hypothetical protein